MALAGATIVPSCIQRALAGWCAGNKRLVVIFQRGGADGLNMVIPHGESAYYRLRPSIAIPQDILINLDGFFGLHPAMSSLKPLWDRRHLAVIHAFGSPAAPSCHIAAQRLVFSEDGADTTDVGWPARLLNSLSRSSGTKSFAAAPGSTLPLIFTGASSCLLTNPCTGDFATGLLQLAQVLKTNPRVRLAYAEMGGWDFHANQGSVRGPFANLLRDFSRSLAAFWDALAELQRDTVLITLSEFGRSVRENDRGGTDHGQGGVMLILGGSIAGGRVYTRWPGLEAGQSGEAHVLPATTDFRSVLNGVLRQHLQCQNVDPVFPASKIKSLSYPPAGTS
jgi:uncharacterized protein (DUF1501 family)